MWRDLTWNGIVTTCVLIIFHSMLLNCPEHDAIIAIFFFFLIPSLLHILFRGSKFLLLHTL